ncbi:zinc ribbon domain-containing protein [Paenibacillus sp. BR2-3]|uniref:zinc ribbon domain-containing protein n=1 Tax=Paenibacillus sp. BR2-3 TaxID=3048494 RepID=UPI003977295D
MEHERIQEQVFCQSCGMPIQDASLLGTDRDGSKNSEYCMYCYETGEFKQPDISLQGMTDLCTGFMVQDGMTEDTARQLLAEQLPRLKRWSALQSPEA